MKSIDILRFCSGLVVLGVFVTSLAFLPLDASDSEQATDTSEIENYPSSDSPNLQLPPKAVEEALKTDEELRYMPKPSHADGQYQGIESDELPPENDAALPEKQPNETTSTSPAPDIPTTTNTAPTTSTLPATTLTTVSKPQQEPLFISEVSNEVYDGLTISNPNGPCIRILDSNNIVLRNSRIGPCNGRAIEIVGSEQVTVESVQISDSDSGIYALDSRTVAIVGSTFSNAGRNFVQFDKVSGPNNRIIGNRGSNRLGGSTAEDFISIYQSSGSPSSPIEIRGNAISSGGPSSSGSGIMVGDKGGSNILVIGNTLTNPGQAGIGVAGGSNIRVINNTVYSAPQAWSNVGIYVWNQSSGSCQNIEVRGNAVEWYDSSGAANPNWASDNCGDIAGWNDNNWEAQIG